MKKGQLDYPIITFAIVVIALLFLGPILLKIGNEILNPFQNTLGNMSDDAGTSIAKVHGGMTNFWDWIFLSAFVVVMVLMFLSSFLIDVHPVFIIIFILAGLMTFIFMPEVMKTVDKLWESPQFAVEQSQMSLTNFLREYFSVVLLGAYLLCGVIIYAKIKYLHVT